jgi:hypothetical protein
VSERETASRRQPHEKGDRQPLAFAFERADRCGLPFRVRRLFRSLAGWGLIARAGT